MGCTDHLSVVRGTRGYEADSIGALAPVAAIELGMIDVFHVAGCGRAGPLPTSWLAVDQALHLLGVALALHLDAGGSVVGLGDLLCAQDQVRGGQVLVQPLEPSGAGDRDDPRLLGEQPGERDLRRCGVLGLGHPAYQVGDGYRQGPPSRGRAGTGCRADVSRGGSSGAGPGTDGAT